MVESLPDTTSETISANACPISASFLDSWNPIYGCMKARRPMVRPTGNMWYCTLTTTLWSPIMRNISWRKRLESNLLWSQDQLDPLSGHMININLANGDKDWGFSLSEYIQTAVNNVKEYLAMTDRKLPSKTLTPIQTSHRLETDTTPELDATNSAYYQLLVGILRCMVKLGLVDICL